MRLPPWSLPRVGSGGDKRLFIATGHLPDAGSTVDPGHSTPRRWKRLRSPSSEGEGGEVGEPRNLFPRLGVG